MREALKRAIGQLAGGALPQCRFDRAVFLLGHMRCGSTALSHVLCAHPEISGYGESHIDYAVPGSLGRLAINQWRRGAWKPGAGRLFDKVLHGRYDASPVPEFFDSTAIFVVRQPEPTIRSIRTLFAALGTGEYASDDIAADYYLARLDGLARAWPRFAPERRIGFSYEAMVDRPEPVIAAISQCLGLNPELRNAYDAGGKVARRGAGDPLTSHLHSSIVKRDTSSGPAPSSRPVALSETRKEGLVSAYRATLELFERPPNAPAQRAHTA